MRNAFKLTFMVILCAVLLSSCYRMSIQQGNALERRAVDQLEVGMTKQQVLALLGKPILESPFEDNYWDYVYTLKERRHPTVIKRLRLQFDYDVLSMIVTDTV